MNEEIKAASVDSPEFHNLAMDYRAASIARAPDAYGELVSHINAWADERCNQLAASRAMLPVTDWKIDGGLIYRLNDEGVNCDEINVTMANGSRSNESRNAAAQSVLAALATPVAGWVSVEERLPECDMRPGYPGVEVMVYPPVETADHTAFYGCRCSDEPSFYKYGALIPHVTHWMPLPAPPAPVTPKQEQS